MNGQAQGRSRPIGEMVVELMAGLKTNSIAAGVRWVTSSHSLSDRFDGLRRAYAHKQRLVDRGLSDWWKGDVHSIADWSSIMSPIEVPIFEDIRSMGLALWPQLPVLNYFVDFGNPEAKVCIECDGAAWHDAQKDAARDSRLKAHGWHVIRIPGSTCFRSYGPARQACIEMLEEARSILDSARGHEITDEEI